MTHFYSDKEKGSREIGVAFVVERNKERNVLDFKAICILRIKGKLRNLSCVKVCTGFPRRNDERERKTFIED
jgi:hypothetical protein